MKKYSVINILLIMFISIFIFSGFSNKETEEKDFIKWVDLNASYQIMERAYELDLKTYNTDKHIKFIDTLAYLTAINGNLFNYKNDLVNFNKMAEKVKDVENVEAILSENKYFKYYKEAYTAIFSQFIGNYKKSDDTECYGIKAYHPIAANYGFSEGDDFGNKRVFGFKRRHLGHDIFGNVGTPIIAVESGTITELGWNKYGGWRIGITSDDTYRYYYYAHLRKNKPYHSIINKGDKVTAGQVIGYMGMTGYSIKENNNMKTNPHLHFGMQLIFDESQKNGNTEIWIDVYQISRFLYKNRAKTVKNAETKDHDSIDIFHSI
jgi:murein DD-endopeptidase MepM/ murein hydrolase activator NlpD